MVTAKISSSLEQRILRTIKNSVKHGDCLVFIYKKKDDTSIGTRFVTPLAIDDPSAPDKDFLIRTKQHYPVEGFRNFNLSKIIGVQRVIPVAEL